MKTDTLREPTPAERFEAAGRNVDESTREIESLRKEFAEYQTRTGLVVRNGIPVSFATPTAESAKEVHEWLACYKKRIYAAEQRFQTRLSVYAGLKAAIAEQEKL